MSHGTMHTLIDRMTGGAQRVSRGLGSDMFWMVTVTLVLAALVVLAQTMSDMAA